MGWEKSEGACQEGEVWAVPPARLALQGWHCRAVAQTVHIHRADGWGNMAEQYRWGWDT